MSRVAIDVGQSGTRVREIDPSGREISHALLPVTGTGKTRELERLIVDAVDALTPASAIEMVAVGATGCFGAPEPMPWLVETLLARHGVTGLVVADDGVTSLLGARGEPFGLVAAAGTGVVAVAVGPDGVARVDGAGPAIGDEGSGRWIGRQGLIAALSVLDGRDGGSRRLLESAEELYGPLRDLPRSMADREAPAASVAAFAERVADVARSGDDVAQRIMDDAGFFLARTVVAAATRAGFGESAFEWCLVGGLARAGDALESSLIGHIRRRLPLAHRSAARGDALDGAASLFSVDTEVFGPMVRRYGYCVNVA